MIHTLGLWVIVALATPLEVRREQEQAEDYVRELYLSKEVEKYCTAHPEGEYQLTYKEMPVTIDCKTRNRWVEQHRNGELPDQRDN